MLRVYWMESWSTSVELHILTTHLRTAESRLHEVIYTGEWVELLSWKKRSHTRGVVALLGAALTSVAAGPVQGRLLVLAWPDLGAPLIAVCRVPPEEPQL